MKLLNVLLATALALFAPVAAAQGILYFAVFSGAAEVDPNDSPGIGIVEVLVDKDLLNMNIRATFANLAAPTTAAHIHCCTAVPFAGAAGVATQTPSFTEFPLGVTRSNTFNQTLDLTQTDSFSSSFVTASGGTAGGAFNALVRGIDTGGAYFNIHTALFPEGEIRGFLTRVVPIPEPQAFFLMLGGLAVVAATVRRKRRT